MSTGYTQEGVFTIYMEAGEVCSHTFGSHILLLFIIVSFDYQMTSPNPSCFGTTTRGIYVTTTYCPLLFKEPERSPGASIFDSNDVQLYEEPSNWHCRAAKCKTCPLLLTTDVFSSFTAREQFKVKVRASCKSSSVMYLITCWRCGQQYVGEMGQPLHYRINGHH